MRRKGSREGYLEASKDWDTDPSLDLCTADGTSFAENTEMSERLDMDEIQRKFFERTICFYHEKGDRANMMLYVNFMRLEDAKRKLFERLEYLDKLLCLEKESGNFVEAARVAKLKAFKEVNDPMMVIVGLAISLNGAMMPLSWI
ncbi:unnamed protein product [Cuscuta campestris]|uniref:Uncharacterized protein n=1 Tax=Cuscuta campestris TaxID=132261 RepID=A0A484NPF8_9ASTE|nr:unnamed protein product [Cuscuta campestris]